jgi:hypothetical protein
MPKSFAIELDGDPAELLDLAHSHASRKGVYFDGDKESGSFAGHGFEGGYSIKDYTLTLNVAKKPFFLPWALVEHELKKFFGAVAVAD